MTAPDGSARAGDDAARADRPADVAAAEPEVTIVPYRDGPLIVRGPVVLRDQDGAVIDAGRSPVALCRCGRSRIRPFCDGSHATTRFRAPSGREEERGRRSPPPPADGPDVAAGGAGGS